MNQKVRVRFAPSPTGGLHLGGVRTVLYNYLFARSLGGDFVLRIEDTDQSRFVPGAEEYILQCLQWCGLEPDEGPQKPGLYGPYRQSERKALGFYQRHAEALIQKGHAYYAFDTPTELEQMRAAYKTPENPSPQYDHRLRGSMKNSLALPAEETRQLLDAGTPYVIRIKVDPDQTIGFTDLIRGDVHFNTSQIDDKVLLKADGMPTYHLAVVVDDFLMKITHAFRGEEWLPSAPVHLLLWRWLFGEENMPRWAHLPLILKPDGNGKLSKRDGDRLGFPVFAMNWSDPKTNELTKGFREMGFLPEAFVNMLAMLGWNDGSGREVFTLDELVGAFSLERVHKNGAKFDFEKARWFNHEWIRKEPVSKYKGLVKELFQQQGILAEGLPPHDKQGKPGGETVGGTGADAGADAGNAHGDLHFEKVLELVRERCTLLTDFVPQSSFFFKAPATLDTASVLPKWNEGKKRFFAQLVLQMELLHSWEAETLEKEFKEIAAADQIKPGDVLLPFRVMLVGGKFGPGVFEIATLLGQAETIRRIRHGLGVFN